MKNFILKVYTTKLFTYLINKFAREIQNSLNYAYQIANALIIYLPRFPQYFWILLTKVFQNFNKYSRTMSQNIK